MRLRSLQTGLAERQAGRFLDISGSALPTGRRRRCRRTSSPPLPDGVGFSAESRQHALGDFQLIELIPEPGPFGITLHRRAARRTRLDEPPRRQATRPALEGPLKVEVRCSILVA